MNNALQMFTMPDLFKTDSLTSKQRSADIPGSKSFDSIYQSKTYDGAGSNGEGFSNRKLADLGMASKKDQNVLSAVKNVSTERRNLVKPEKQEVKDTKSDAFDAVKAKTVNETPANEVSENLNSNPIKKKIEAMKKVLKEASEDIDKAVQNGSLSPDQAEMLKAALSSMEEQLSALENASAAGLIPEGKLDDVLTKLDSGLSNLKQLQMQLLKSGKPQETPKGTSESGEVSNNSSFDQVLGKLKSALEELTSLNNTVKAGIKLAQAPTEKLVEQSVTPEGQSAGKAGEEAAKQTAYDQSKISNSSITNGSEDKALKAATATTVGTGTAQSTSTPSADPTLTAKNDVVANNLSTAQQAENTSSVKNIAMSGASTEDANAAKGQKVEADVTIKQVDVAKFENTLIQTAKTEAPQAMKRFESNIMQQIQNMMQNSVKFVKTGNSEMVIRLKPENLGNVSLKLNMEGGSLSAEFKVENLMVKAMIESNMTDLKNALTDKGYNVSGFDVSLGQDGGTNAGQHSRDGHERRSQNSGRDSENGGTEKKSGFESEMQRKQLDDRSSVINSLG